MKRKATLIALSSKARDKEIIVLDKIEISAPKTKEAAIIVNTIVPNQSTALLMIPGKNEIILRASRNIPRFKVINVLNINILDLLNHKYLILLKDTVDALKKKYGTV